MLNATEIRECRLVVLNAVTEYDQKQANKPGYNIYALPQYIAKLDDFQAFLEQGISLKRAIMKCYLGRLMTFVGKQFGIKYTSHEVRFCLLGEDELTEMEKAAISR